MKSTIKHFRTVVLFFDFLYQKNEFYEFYQNFLLHGDHDGDADLFKYLTSTPSELFVCNAFEFNKTSQDFAYWMNVDMDWQDFLTKNIK